MLLARDDVLARAVEGLGREEAELVQQLGGGPRLAGESFAVGAVLLAEAGEERLLEREDEGRGLGRRGAVARTRRGEARQHVAHLRPRGALDLSGRVLGHRLPQEPDERPRLLFHLRAVDPAGRLREQTGPLREEAGLLIAQDCREPTLMIHHDALLSGERWRAPPAGPSLDDGARRFSTAIRRLSGRPVKTSSPR